MDLLRRNQSSEIPKCGPNAVVLNVAARRKTQKSANEHKPETGIGGVKTYRTLDGGELAPKVAPPKLGLLTPKLAIFSRKSEERRQFQGPLEIQNFHPPSNFRRFDPPYPGLQTKERTRTQTQERKREQRGAKECQAPPSCGSGRYGFGVFEAQDSFLSDRCSVGRRHVLCSITLLSIQAVSWVRQSSVTRSGIPGQKPQIIHNF